jgi:hypothetical protein
MDRLGGWPEWERVPDFWNLFFACLTAPFRSFPSFFGLVGDVYHFKGRRRTGVEMVKL